MRGYLRLGGAPGARNHVLVLPSVVCSGLTAQRIAGEDAIAVTHQHGCAHIGDDSDHTRDVFAGMATNPNVGGALVVGLGCETIQGKEVAARVEAAGQRVRYAGIQADGGTEATVRRGQQLVAELRAELAADLEVEVDARELTLGLDDPDAPFADALAATAAAAGARLLVAGAGEIGGTGPESHPDLATAGAQVIVGWCGPGEGPRGFAICPVLSVSGDADLFAALADDFDLDGSGDDPEATAAAVWARALDAFGGQETAAERRGARDFFLRRLARTM